MFEFVSMHTLWNGGPPFISHSLQLPVCAIMCVCSARMIAMRSKPEHVAAHTNVLVLTSSFIIFIFMHIYAMHIIIIRSCRRLALRITNPALVNQFIRDRKKKEEIASVADKNRTEIVNKVKELSSKFSRQYAHTQAHTGEKSQNW